ncbi:MAG: HNH endonuclease [Armatimonadetes bacterium]|nr:HNH endonuclease [Armatimonadota bacterium]
MNPLYGSVAQRAGHRCEYCHAPEAVFNFPFEVEHILPVARAGGDAGGNLALSCRSCNLRKAAYITGIDPEGQGIAPLFHPREDEWAAHFRIDEESAEVQGLTASGRATVTRLGMNSPAQRATRRQWMRLGLFP